MSRVKVLILAVLVSVGLAVSTSHAADSLQPKYGGEPRTPGQEAADRKFLAEMDAHFKGDRRKAAQEATKRGWAFLRQGNVPDAMRRFNQAWLLDNTSGSALWGMAAVQGTRGKLDESLALLREAEGSMAGDVDFQADYARTIGMLGAQTRNKPLVEDALSRFARVHARAPEHTLNLQNWAIILFYIGDYAGAWQKIKLAEATPQRQHLDPRFLSDLSRSMPRPE